MCCKRVLVERNFQKNDFFSFIWRFKTTFRLILSFFCFISRQWSTYQRTNSKVCVKLSEYHLEKPVRVLNSFNCFMNRWKMSVLSNNESCYAWTIFLFTQTKTINWFLILNAHILFFTIANLFLSSLSFIYARFSEITRTGQNDWLTGKINALMPRDNM